MPDFEYWKELYETNFEEAERQRKQVLLDALQKRFPDNEDIRQRLEAIVFSVDAKLDRIKNPIERVNQLQVHFWEQVAKFEKALKGEVEEQNKKDNVVSFKKS